MSKAMKQMRSWFKKHADEYLGFESIPEDRRRSKRPDLHAFLLLDSLIPGDRDMVCGARHDEIFLDVDAEDLAKVATEEIVVELTRCGVLLNDGYLAMFA